MKNNQINDERIIAERRKIQSRGYAWIVTILLISVIVQQFLLKAPFAQYAVEFFVLMGCGVYNIISNYKKGIDIWNPRGDDKKKIFLNTLISGIISVILFAYLSGNHKINSLLSYFISFVTFIFIFRLIMIGINKKKQGAIEKELNDEDIIE